MSKITCEPIKNIFCKKTGEYKASFGTYSETGTTKNEAIDKLNTSLDWFFGEDFVIQWIQTKNQVFVMERLFEGYRITVIYRNSKYTSCVSWLDRMPVYQAENKFKEYVNNWLSGMPEDSLLFE